MPLPSELERLSRQELIARAQRFGVPRPELMTRVELTDEIVRRSEADPTERKRARGWLGIARDLLASVVEQGLHLPDAAALIRGEAGFELGGKAPSPVATVTLAEIYAAQGHLDRALKMLDQVLDKEPDHDPARTLRDRFVVERDRRLALKAAARAREPARPVAQDLEPVEALEQAPPEAGLAEMNEPEPVAVAEPEPVAVAEPEPEPVAEPEPVVVAEPEQEPMAVAEPVAAAEPEPVVVAEPEPAPIPIEATESVGPTHDSVVVMRSEVGKIRVYWEFRSESRQRAEQRWPEGRAVVRVVGWRTSWDGAQRVEHDVEIKSDQDSVTIDALGEVAAVRAALGWRASGELHPFSLAPELAAGASASAFQLLWVPPGQKGMGTNPSAIAARALEHSGFSSDGR